MEERAYCCASRHQQNQFERSFHSPRGKPCGVAEIPETQGSRMRRRKERRFKSAQVDPDDEEEVAEEVAE